MSLFVTKIDFYLHVYVVPVKRGGGGQTRPWAKNRDEPGKKNQVKKRGGGGCKPDHGSKTVMNSEQNTRSKKWWGVR